MQEIKFWQVLAYLSSGKVQGYGAVGNAELESLSTHSSLPMQIGFLLDKTREKFSEDYCTQIK